MHTAGDAPVTRRKIIQIILGLALVSALAVRLNFEKHPLLAGQTMGTVYRVTIGGYIGRNRLDALGSRIEETLREINRQMSTWDPESEISLFNASDECGPFPVSPAFAEVVARALEFGKATDGAFDATLQPLLNLWGFGSGSEGHAVPSEEAIAAVMRFTGPDMVWIEDSTNLWKAAPEVQIDLSAIAKGYSVDAISRLLDDAGHENWFVEVGGEVRVRGRNPAGAPWRIGIQHPSSNPAVDRLQGIVHLTNGAVATSGDYRNFMEKDGVIYSHLLDPRHGHAVLSDTASVTVVAPGCMDADAAATALFVMEIEEALRWIEKQPEAEALFLLRDGDGQIFARFSSGFTNATGYSSLEEAP
jgi:thiamine biosynthesis lipoprotein